MKTNKALIIILFTLLLTGCLKSPTAEKNKTNKESKTPKTTSTTNPELSGENVYDPNKQQRMFFSPPIEVNTENAEKDVAINQSQEKQATESKLTEPAMEIPKMKTNLNGLSTNKQQADEFHRSEKVFPLLPEQVKTYNQENTPLTTTQKVQELEKNK